MKRFRPRAKGRASQLRNHLVELIVLEEKIEKKEKKVTK